MSEPIYSVSEITAIIKNCLQKDSRFVNVQIKGEISNFKRYTSGHCYFSLKDKNSILKAVMFKNSAQYLTFEPTNGTTVIACGRISVYERDGVYQLYTEIMIPDGIGSLMLEYEALKQRLSAEGLFALESKKLLPTNPYTVGIITSSSGAAVHDLITVSKRRNKGVKLLLYPVRVQGSTASKEIGLAIEFFNRHKLADILIVGRGGGSIEELWAFNEENTVRAIAASKIPIISAVGHESDFTLADLAADCRAATPSQAAELAVPKAISANQIFKLRSSLVKAAIANIQHNQNKFGFIKASWIFKNPERLFEKRMQLTDSLTMSLNAVFKNKLAQDIHTYELLVARLQAVSPLTIIKRGYSLAYKSNGSIITSIDNVQWGEEIVTKLNDGIIVSVVQETERRELQ